MSDDIGITVGAVSKLIDRLERDGLVQRRLNPSDRRSSLIALTAAGGSRLTTALTVAQAAVTRAIGGEDVQPLVAALARLQTQVDADPSQLAPSVAPHSGPRQLTGKVSA